MSRTFLYRRLGSAVIILAFFALTVLHGVAQGRPQLKRPQDDTPEKLPEEKKPKKKVKGPRAVGLLQLNSSGKGSLIPIAILVDGKFYDASAYKAEPVPMALESGTVYEVEQTGDSQGLFTVNGALHTKAVGSAHPWTGTGSFLPRGTEVAKTTRKAEDVPVGLDTSDSDAPPRLTRGKGSKSADPDSKSSPPSDKASGSAASDKPAASSPPASTPPASGSSDGKSSGNASSGSTSSSTTSSGKDSSSNTAGSTPSGQDKAKPADSSPSEKAADKTANQDGKGEAQKTPQMTPAATPPSGTASSQTSTSASSTDQGAAGKKSEDYYRPTLRRGKPTEPAPQDDELSVKPGQSQSSTPAGSTAATSSSAGAPQFIPAISDDGGPEPRSYKFFWKTGEEDERRNQMLELAANELRTYTTALARNFIPAKPAPPKTAAAVHKAPSKPAAPVFENTQFHAYDVWGNNQAVMILSTEAHFPPTPGSDKAPETYSITLATRTDIYGNLRKIYSGVTDRFHLDVTPKLEVIDAVDADGDGRGELLFREATDTGNGFVIYRATGDKLWKMFDSLSE